MRCLVVGGTGFLGGAIVDAAAAVGHSMSVLARGQTGRAQPAGIEFIQADRHDTLDTLAGRSFDWVFDSCAYSPDAVHRLLDAVGEGLKRYVLISSISAYGTFEKEGLNEDDPVPAPTDADLAVAAAVPAADRASAAAYGESYGRLKRACELAAAERLGNRATALRVGLLVGAGDYTNRLTWWVRRIDQARGSQRRVPAPGPPDRPVQFVDARDAAGFALTCAENGLGGIWNVTGQEMALSDVLDAVATAAGSEPEFVWRDDAAILEAGIAPWTDMPLMAPSMPEFRHFLQVDAGKARAEGLTCRPLADTLGRLLDWDRGRRDQPLGVGLTAEQEARLLG